MTRRVKGETSDIGDISHSSCWPPDDSDIGANEDVSDATASDTNNQVCDKNH